MRIIIEGVDKSGKSTLINALKNKVPRAVLLKLWTKPEGNQQEATAYIRRMYMNMAQMTVDLNNNYIFDRWYPSEMVYSFKRGYDSLKDGWFYELEKEIVKTRPLYILVEADPDLIRKRMAEDKEDFAKPEEVEKLQERYREHFKYCQLNKMVVNTTDDLDATVEHILSVIEETKDIKTQDFTKAK